MDGDNGSEPRADGVRVGCDVQSLAEVSESLERFGEKYLRRVLSADERSLAAAAIDTDALARHVCGRFAAKEAVFKVLGGAATEPVPWPQIEVLADVAGGPYVRLSGRPAVLADDRGIGEVAVSISHSGSFAFAVAVAVTASVAPPAAASLVESGRVTP